MKQKSPPENLNTTIITFAPDGSARCLWTELVPLQELGQLEMERASNVEFNPIQQQWDVRDPSGRLLYSHRSRSACLAWEHNFFNH